MRRLALVLALFAVLALPLGAVASASTAGNGAHSSMSGSATLDGHAVAQMDEPEEAGTSTELTVQLREDRDARWTVEMRYPIESDNETAAFQQYGEAYEDGEADGALDADTFETLAASSSSVAGREMMIQNVSRSATVSDDVGVLTLSFTWTQFLSADRDQLVLRDALLLPNDRTWLASLDADQRLIIETPPGYSVNSTNAPVVQRSGTVIIEGPRTFDTDEPLTIRYEPTTGVAGYPWEIVAGIALALVVLLIVLLIVLARRRNIAPGEAVTDQLPGSLSGPGTDDGAPPDPRTGGDAESSSPSASASPGSGVGPNASARGDSPDSASGTGRDGSGGAGPGKSTGADLSLLSDEERVERLLERNDGRMRQADIVAETGWSDAKVSQLLSSMAEEGRVEKLRLGRENLISLPEDGDGGDDA